MTTITVGKTTLTAVCYCGSTNVHAGRRGYVCRDCGRRVTQFTITPTAADHHLAAATSREK